MIGARVVAGAVVVVVRAASIGDERLATMRIADHSRSEGSGKNCLVLRSTCTYFKDEW